MVVCSKCGHPNPEGSNFCSHCGSRLPVSSTIGDTTSVISVVEEDATRNIELTAEDAAAIHDLPAGDALLIVTRGPNVGARYLLDSDITTAGRSPDSDIFLDDITVSRRHAQFLRAGGQITIKDEGSLNGTYVNRTLVDGSALLRSGDEVQIGKFRMMFFVSERGMR